MAMTVEGLVRPSLTELSRLIKSRLASEIWELIYREYITPIATYCMVGDRLYAWGGYQPGLPFVHDNTQKKEMLSSVKVYDIANASFATIETIGTPPNGAMGFRCCNVDNDVYYFGGRCKTGDCYHNNLFVLHTQCDTWEEIECTNSPMKKSGCGMISFGCNDEADYLMVIGGVGIPAPDHDADSDQYVPFNMFLPLCRYTNEVHIMCTSSDPGRWTIPVRSGSLFPPSAIFSLNYLPGNKAILFGGFCVRDGKTCCTNDVFIISFSANSVNFLKIVKPSSPLVQWPKERSYHSGTVISSKSSDGVRKDYLVILGGIDSNTFIIPDCWIMDIERQSWNQLPLPEAATKRFGHSVNSFVVSTNCVWLLIAGSDNVMKIELVFSHDRNEWAVCKVQDSKNAIPERISEGGTSTTNCQPIVGKKVPELEKENNELRQQLKDTEEEMSGWMNELYEQHQEKLSNELEEKNRLYDQLREKDAIIQEKEEIIQEQEEIIQEKDYALQNQLDSHPWILQAEEVQITDEVLGGGAYGQVKLAIFRGTRVAAKCLHSILVSRYNLSIFTREMDISSKIHHPNIVQFIGAVRVESVDNPILLYELMTTSLYKRLNENDEAFTQPQIVDIASDVSSAMCYIHLWKPHSLIHRDISSPNVLMQPLANEKWQSKLSDFGSANLQLHVKTAVPGNPAYAAPEAIDPREHSPAMDVYSFGVLVTEIILHLAPEIDIEKRETQFHCITWREMKAIVLNCVKYNRNERLTSIQLLESLQSLKNEA